MENCRQMKAMIQKLQSFEVQKFYSEKGTNFFANPVTIMFLIKGVICHKFPETWQVNI